MRSVTAPNAGLTASEWNIPQLANTSDMTPATCREDVSWQGTSSTDFNEVGSNWNGTRGFVPDASYNVSIPNVTNKPIVTRLSVVYSLSVQTGASIEINPSVSMTVIK
ncbi:MAG: hypothetical protein L3J66_13355 [Bacteroidales bacterium]|nr:hypothetical protein [Bacteroidales bacterium]